MRLKVIRVENLSKNQPRIFAFTRSEARFIAKRISTSGSGMDWGYTFHTRPIEDEYFDFKWAVVENTSLGPANMNIPEDEYKLAQVLAYVNSKGIKYCSHQMRKYEYGKVVACCALGALRDAGVPPVDIIGWTDDVVVGNDISDGVVPAWYPGPGFDFGTAYHRAMEQEE